MACTEMLHSCIISYPLLKKSKFIGVTKQGGTTSIERECILGTKSLVSFISRCYEDKRSIYFEHGYGRKYFHETKRV